MATKVRTYGWKKPQSKPTNLHLFSISRSNPLIRKLDLSPLFPPVYNQGELGSCTANALAACYQYCEIKEKEAAPFMPSRLFIYYNERQKEGDISEDAGAEISDGVDVINKIGVCPEAPVKGIDSSAVWPYNPAKFAQKPPSACYALAKKHHTSQYKPISQSISHIKQSIINGFPVAFGFQVYSSFEGPQIEQDGVLHLPAANEQLVGGHAVVCVGFDDDFVIDGVAGAVKVRNSWGADWGLHGYFMMPYNYISNTALADDLWSVLHTVDV